MAILAAEPPSTLSTTSLAITRPSTIAMCDVCGSSEVRSVEGLTVNVRSDIVVRFNVFFSDIVSVYTVSLSATATSLSDSTTGGEGENALSTDNELLLLLFLCISRIV